MSLNFQFTDKKRFEALTEDERSMNDTYVWGCMMVDLRDITEKNAAEWQRRYAFAVDLNGASYSVNGKDYRPTVEDVRKRIGLQTNADQKTWEQFVAKQVRLWEQRNPK